MFKPQNIKYFVCALFLVASLSSGFFVTMPVQAQNENTPPAGCPGGPAGPPSPGTECPEEEQPCQEGTTRNEETGACEIRTDCEGENSDGNINPDNCEILRYLATFINVLSALVGVIIVIMIAIGGIQYTTARDNPQMVVAARARIYNAILALVIFLFSYAFLQWLIPGGVF